MSGSSLRLEGRDDDSTQKLFASTAAGAVSTNDWQHVAAVFNADTDVHKIYVNGIELASNSLAAQPFVDAKRTWRRRGWGQWKD